MGHGAWGDNCEFRIANFEFEKEEGMGEIADCSFEKQNGVEETYTKQWNYAGMSVYPKL